MRKAMLYLGQGICVLLAFLTAGWILFVLWVTDDRSFLVTPGLGLILWIIIYVILGLLRRRLGGFSDKELRRFIEQ